MFTLSRTDLLSAVREMRNAVCVYGPLNNTRCDCKYGHAGFPIGMVSGPEQTGCPELRNVEELLVSMTDAEYDECLRRCPIPQERK